MMNTEKSELNEMNLEDVNAGTGCVVSCRKLTSERSRVQKILPEADNLLWHGDTDHTVTTLPENLGRRTGQKKSRTGTMC